MVLSRAKCASQLCCSLPWVDVVKGFGALWVTTEGVAIKRDSLAGLHDACCLIDFVAGCNSCVFKNSYLHQFASQINILEIVRTALEDHSYHFNGMIWLCSPIPKYAINNAVANLSLILNKWYVSLGLSLPQVWLGNYYLKKRLWSTVQILKSN